MYYLRKLEPDRKRIIEKKLDPAGFHIVSDPAGFHIVIENFLI
jgi:hypothetical protein